MKLSYIIEELLSPIVTPFILIFKLRYRSAEIVDFLRTSTVDVQGVGDVCSLAQLDLKMASQTSDETNFDRSSKFFCFYYCSKYIYPILVRPSSPKTELSLLNFSVRHPNWQPASNEAQQLLDRIKSKVRQYFETSLSPFCVTNTWVILLIISDSGNVPEWTNFTKSKSSTRPNVEFIAAWCLPSITSGTKYASDLTRKLSAVIY